MKIETLAEKVGLTYEQFEAYAYLKFYEHRPLQAAAACRAARNTSHERCSQYDYNSFGVVVCAYYLDNPSHFENLKK